MTEPTEEQLAKMSVEELNQYAKEFDWNNPEEVEHRQA